METFKSVSFSLLLAFFIIITVGFLLPRKIHIDRSHLLKADPATILEQIDVIQNWENWSPWSLDDSTMKIDYSGTTGAGAGFTWVSKDKLTKDGHLEIQFSNSSDTIKAVLYPKQHIPVHLLFTIDEQDSISVLRCAIDLELKKNPFLRYFGLFMEKRFGRYLDESFERLDSVAARVEALHPPLRMKVREIPAFSYIFLEYNVPFQRLSDYTGTAYTQLIDQIKNPSAVMAGPPFMRYLAYDSLNLTFRAGIPVQPWFKPVSPIKLDTSARTKALIASYYGSYAGIAAAYEKMQTFCRNRHLKPDTFTWENYITDPKLEPDTSKWLTEIVFPLHD